MKTKKDYSTAHKRTDELGPKEYKLCNSLESLGDENILKYDESDPIACISTRDSGNETTVKTVVANS